MPVERGGITARVLRRLGFEREWALIPVGALVGVLTGVGAVVFAAVLHGVERAVVGVSGSGSGLGWWLVWLPVMPMVGAAGTAALVHFFAADARGHGVPQVMRAILQKNGYIPLRVGMVKALASICTVGTGGSSGTEGPIVQIGATGGSWVGRRLRIGREFRTILVGCGAAAGIASIFNAPIAGVFFVLEILLRDFSIRTFTPIVISSVLSAATTQSVQRWLSSLSPEASETIGRAGEAIFFTSTLDASYVFTMPELPLYVVLGVVCGLIGVGFNRFLHAGEDLGKRVRIHPLVKPVVGALLLGLLGIGVLLVTRGAAEAGSGASVSRQPAVFGNGYDVIRWALNPGSYGLGMPGAADGVGGDGAGGHGPGVSLPAVVWVLVLIAAAKVLATTFTLASGGSGGVFAPSLFLGAVGGGAFGLAVKAVGLMPGGSSPAAYALVGMAAVLAGSSHAPLTAILMLLELTRDEYVLLPIMLAAIVATITARAVDRDSIYTMELRREGLLMGTARDVSILRRLTVGEVERSALPPEPVFAADPVSKLVALHAVYNVPDFPVVDPSGLYLGMVTGSDVRSALIDREAIPLLLVAELLRVDLPVVTPGESLDRVIEKLSKHDVSALCVVSSEAERRPVGLVTRAAVDRLYHAALSERE